MRWHDTYSVGPPTTTRKHVSPYTLHLQFNIKWRQCKFQLRPLDHLSPFCANYRIHQLQGASTFGPHSSVTYRSAFDIYNRFKREFIPWFPHCIALPLPTESLDFSVFFSRTFSSLFSHATQDQEHTHFPLITLTRTRIELQPWRPLGWKGWGAWGRE